MVAQVPLNPPVVPRPAATLVLLRDASSGLEVLMLRRSESAVFAGGAFVFPGGRVDASDNDPRMASCCAGLDSAAANRALGVDADGLGYWVAAIRECFEEAGLMLACDESGHRIRHDPDVASALFLSDRSALIAQRLSFLQVIQNHRLRLATDALVYFGHWITQAGRPRRFDTRFFVAAAPSDQSVSHDGTEVVQHVWIRPDQALEQQRAGELLLMFPTMRTLESLRPFSTVDQVLAFARLPRRVSAITPISAMGRGGPQLLVPGDHAFAEVTKLDPGASGQVSCELQAGRVVQLSARVRRITAPRSDGAELAGVNTYLLGDSAHGIAVIDPGPADEAHREAILAAAGQAIRWILFTHAHAAHAAGGEALLRCSPGAQALPARSGSGEERLSLGGFTLCAVPTPGHAHDHVCFILLEEKIAFTGDHLSQGPLSATVAHYEASMVEFIDSLRRLQAYELDYVAPGHGFLMDRPGEMLERALNERLGRESRVLRALREADASKEDELLELAFQDVPAAARIRWQSTLLAHLDKLAAEGRARKIGLRWRAA